MRVKEIFKVTEPNGSTRIEPMQGVFEDRVKSYFFKGLRACYVLKNNEIWEPSFIYEQTKPKVQ